MRRGFGAVTFGVGDDSEDAERGFEVSFRIGILNGRPGGRLRFNLDVDVDAGRADLTILPEETRSPSGRVLAV